MVPVFFWTGGALAGPFVQTSTNATFGSPPTQEDFPDAFSPSTHPPHRIKSELIDKDDYYILSSGKKKQFYRAKDHYVLVIRQDRARDFYSKSIETQLNSVFAGQAEVLQAHSLNGHMVVKVTDHDRTGTATTSLKSLDPAISFVSPLLTDKNHVLQAAVLPKLIVRFHESPHYNDFIRRLGSVYPVTLIGPLAFTDREYEFQIIREIDDISEIFQLVRLIAAEDFVEWSEPAILTSLVKFFTPNDPFFSNQWHLHNTGQNDGAVDADVDAPEGWDLSQGNGTVVAIFDDGVQTNHPDIPIWNNPGESGDGKESNGIDDDANSFIDDYQGWDFGDGDNDPSPAGADDNHGTAVAGVAAASGNNSTGVSGGAVNAQILPVRSGAMTCTDWGNAMRYAAKYADVVNVSWHIGGCESELDSAIADAVNGNIPDARRGTKGTPILCATGNNASGWRKYTITGFPADTYLFRWEYIKNASDSAGYDTVWLDDIQWPGGSASDFETDTVSSVPSTFTSGGDAQWLVVSDGTHARSASGNSVKAGTISDSQTTYLETIRAVGAGTLTFWVWVSSEQDSDYFYFSINGFNFFSFAPGQYGHENTVAYPASNTNTIAVGASNDGGPSGLEERSDYSQFGPEVDVVAPSSGGYQGITTTDRTGSDGYDSTSDYISTFGGTSSATPLAAGISAVLLSYAPDITATKLRNKLREGAEKIGPYSYTEIGNDYYGYGRVNLNNSLIIINTPTVTTQAVSGIGKTSATGNGNITDLGKTNPTQHGVCWNTSGNPDTDDNCTQEGAVSATGAFTALMIPLEPDTEYYVRAYATNTAGTAYGMEVSLKTLKSGLPLLYLPPILKKPNTP